MNKKEENKKYQREYYAKNRMKILAYMRMYYDKKIEEEGRMRKRKYTPKSESEKQTIRFYHFSEPRVLEW